MKRLIIFAVISFLFAPGAFSQNIDGILAGIESNNTTLTALRKNAEAERIGNRTGLSLKNPELEFSYLWGSPENIGKRNDIRIMQSFDFPTAYAYRNQISELRNIQVELELERQRRDILLKARQLCNSVIYHNVMQAEIGRRLENARRIADTYEAKFKAGETGIIDVNKARVNLLNFRKDAESNEIERQTLLADLVSLNGGKPVELNDTVYPLQALPADFEEWYAGAEQNNPLLQWLKQEVSVTRKDEQLSLAMSLPRLQAGYMSEKVVGQQYQGISFGIAIPLLENRNEVKYAKARTVAVQSAESDARLLFYNNLKALHARAVSLRKSLDDYRQNLQVFSNASLLQKALYLGELSLAEFLYEQTFYYESFDKLTATEKELYDAVAELNRYG
ncbi:MAG: TolC family protein [Bacteroidota bacterium]|nr:TolC family protein [Bacteroidota bacterium]